MVLVTVIFWIAGAYAFIGLSFAIAFVMRGIDLIEEAAVHAPLGVRLLLLPGSIVLWPWLALKWRHGGKA